MMKSKKNKVKVKDSFNGNFLRNFVGGGHSFIIFFKGSILKNLGNSDLKHIGKILTRVQKKIKHFF